MLRTLSLLVLALIQTVRSRRVRGAARSSWSFGFEWVVRFLRRDWEDSSTWPLPRRRAELDARMYPRTAVRKVARRDGKLAGVPARWFVPPEGDELRCILFLHGGSFIFGSARSTHEDLAARLALASGTTVVVTEYRLAPEHPFPAQLEDAISSFDALVAGGVKEHSIVVVGDSAGANLALALQLALRDRGGRQAAAAVLISPWTDLEMPGRSFVENDPFDYGTREVLLDHARAFAGGIALGDPRISPIHAAHEGLAPVHVTLGEVELLRDDILALVARLEAAGVAVTLHRAEDMPHNPPVFAAYHRSAQRALEEAARFVKRAIRGA